MVRRPVSVSCGGRPEEVYKKHSGVSRQGTTFDYERVFTDRFRQKQIFDSVKHVFVWDGPYRGNRVRVTISYGPT